MGSAPHRGSGHSRGCEWGLHHRQGVNTGKGVNGVCFTGRVWTQDRV